jgi:hypothetical protein
MTGLIAGGDTRKLSTPYYDNLLINPPHASVPAPTPAIPGQTPIYQNSY